MDNHPTLRPFGSAADLDVDFASGDRPALVTAVLARRAADDGYWWSQPVGTRTAALLRVVDEARLGFSADCNCGERLEFELPVDALVDGDAPVVAVAIGDRAVTLRRPTGGDLRDWRTAPPVPHAAMVRRMIDTLTVEGEVRDGDEAVLATALTGLDPLVEFVAACVCPECGAHNAVPVDLEAAALGRLERRQRGLFGEVHRLASHYGWTEAEALGVPPVRRAHYLALIEDAR